MSHELYKKYRPKLLKEVVGQPGAVKVLTRMVKKGKIPHAVLFTGPSGCGKTTLARILVSKLKCGSEDFSEINCADFRGIDMVRDIRNRMNLTAMFGENRVWLIDEAHKLTGDAQTAILKMLEDTPDHVYFMLCTTDPNKLIRTIRTRCTEIKVHNLRPQEMGELVGSIIEKEGKQDNFTDEVIERIVEVAEGSARKALVLLDAIIDIESEKAQLEAILKNEAKHEAIEIARALLNDRNKWPDLSKILKKVEEEPETIRRIVLAYMTSVLLGGGRTMGRAALIIDAFRDHWYDCGKAGLVASCYQVLNGG